MFLRFTIFKWDCKCKSFIAQNMPQYSFSLTHIFPNKDRICDSALMREYTRQKKSGLWHMLGSSVVILTLPLVTLRQANVMILLMESNVKAYNVTLSPIMFMFIFPFFIIYSFCISSPYLTHKKMLLKWFYIASQFLHCCSDHPIIYHNTTILLT